MACKSTDELMKLTQDKAEAYLRELADVEPDDELLKKAAGGRACGNLVDRLLSGKD